MRSDQYIGLHDRATEWIRKNVEQMTTEMLSVSSVNGVEVHRGTTSYIGPAAEEYDHIEGAWDENVAPLMRYTLHDGREAEEYVQDHKWSSGPMYFVALRWVATGEPIPETLWTETEVMEEP